MGRSQLNSAKDPDPEPDMDRRLDLAAELLARIAVRLADGESGVDEELDQQQAA